MKTPIALSVLAIAAAAGSALGQQPVQLQLRVVPVSGGFGAATPLVADSTRVNPAAGPTQVNLLANQSQRFRVDYRIIDLISGDTIHPAGLTSGLLNITASTTGSLATATVGRGTLSTRENAQGAVPPAGAPNAGNTGNLGNDATAVNGNARTGLASPFRGGMSDQNNNSDTANGTIAGLNINGILPLSLSQNNQGLAGFDDGSGNPAFPLTGNEWYVLYIFSVSSGSGSNGTVTFNIAFAPDQATGNTFGYFQDGNSVPQTSTNSVGASAFVSITPAPGAVALLGMGGLLAARRRRTA